MSLIKRKVATAASRDLTETYSIIRVRPAAGRRQRGWLIAPGLALPVALGRGGIIADKREGDGGTPRGVFHPVRVWYRADRLPRPATVLPVRPIKSDDAWCEDPRDRRYNRPMHWDGSGDRLVRNDHLYDLIVEIDHNSSPRVAGRGSAVFLHLARANLAPTAGCVSMPRGPLLRLIARLRPDSAIVIGYPPN